MITNYVHDVIEKVRTEILEEISAPLAINVRRHAAGTLGFPDAYRFM